MFDVFTSYYQQLVAAGVIGLIWPVIQAAFDKVDWTANRRRVIVLAAGVILSVVVWFAGAHPDAWQAIIAQFGLIVGFAQTSFTALKKIGVLDWVGAVTPGGEGKASYEARHLTGVDTVSGNHEVTVGFPQDPKTGEFDVLDAFGGDPAGLNPPAGDDTPEVQVPAEDKELNAAIAARQEAETEAAGAGME